VNRIKEIIDAGGGALGGMGLGGMGNPLQALQQRAWLIHWSLFVFFNHPKGRDHIIDLFLYQVNTQISLIVPKTLTSLHFGLNCISFTEMR
jgi:hypothetical protein